MHSATGAPAFWKDLRTPANLVSLARVVLIYLCIVLWELDYKKATAILGPVAGFTDYLDGYLARKFNQSTRVGALLDQAADVLFIVGVIHMFVKAGLWPNALFYVAFFREIIVLNLRVSAAQQGFEIPSIFWGKWASNWMFYSLALMGIFTAEFFPNPYNTWVRWVADFGMLVGVTSSVLVGMVYVKGYVARYRRADA